MTFIHKWADLKEGVIVGDNTIIGGFVTIEKDAVIGNNVTIQPYSIISSYAVIESNVFIGPHFSCANVKYIPDGTHGQAANKKPGKEEIMVIGQGTRIGTRCTVGPGVHIGKNCFIKMNCVIYDNVPDNTTVYANTRWELDYG